MISCFGFVAFSSFSIHFNIVSFFLFASIYSSLKYSSSPALTVFSHNSPAVPTLSPHLPLFSSNVQVFSLCVWGQSSSAGLGSSLVLLEGGEGGGECWELLIFHFSKWCGNWATGSLPNSPSSIYRPTNREFFSTCFMKVVQPFYSSVSINIS